MHFTRGVMRCYRCDEEFVPSRCAATASTLCSLTSRIIHNTGVVVNELKLNHVLRIMTYEDMLHVAFAAAHNSYELDIEYTVLENAIDLEILSDVVSAVSSRKREIRDVITSPPKRRREIEL